MGLEAPVRAGIHAGGGEGAQHAQFVLPGLNVVSDGLQGREVVDLGSVLDNGAIQRAVLGQQVLVVDQAVGLDDVGQTQHLTVLLQGEVVALELLVDLGIAQVQAVVAPGLQTHRAVHLKQGRRFGLFDLGAQGVFIGAGGGGHNGHGHTGLLGVHLGQSFPLFSLLGLEVQIVNRAGSGGLGHGEDVHHAKDHRSGNQHSQDLFHNWFHSFLIRPRAVPQFQRCANVFIS